MGKNRSASGLVNVIQYDDNGNISFVSGSTTLMSVSSSGAITTTGVISGSNVESSSLAQNSNLLQGTGSVGFTTTASFTATSGSASSRLTQIEAVYATTGSNSFRATQSITGSLTVTGQIIAQTINVQQVTSSIVYSSGSNVFGCDINSRQTFTGSVLITGSLMSTGVGCFSSYISANGATLIADTLLPIQINAGASSQAYFASNNNGTYGMLLGYDNANGYARIRNVSNTSLTFETNNTERARILNTGVACFACQVCVPQLIVCKTYSANNLMLSVANSTMSVPFVTYDTAIIQADDVTTLKIVERNGGAADNQVLTLSTGDNYTRISTSGINPLQFFVGGSSAGCGYNGLGGKNALSIACSGISTFNYPVYMGNISHYNNYSNTSGCFAVFYASQGAIIYLTSMHNGGRSTYQLIYSNGATGGASVSVVGSTSAYGPSNTSFGLCANGWVYAYQPYGGPTDWYAINMNGSFSWAF